MSNLFQKTSSNWVRYDKYEWKEDKEGMLYITPSPDAKVSLYNPLKDAEQMVLKAVNLGLMCMDKNNTQERLQNAIMDFATGYGLLGFMTALPTIVWDFHSLLLGVQMMFSFILTDEKFSLKICKHCGKAFVASRPNSVFCSGKCKNQYNVYKSRAKDKDNTN